MRIRRNFRAGQPASDGSRLRPIGWRGWNEDHADRIRERILRGDYNRAEVIDRVARRLLASGVL